METKQGITSRWTTLRVLCVLGGVFLACMFVVRAGFEPLLWGKVVPWAGAIGSLVFVGMTCAKSRFSSYLLALLALGVSVALMVGGRFPMLGILVLAWAVFLWIEDGQPTVHFFLSKDGKEHKG